jgi:putative membrane protein
MDLPLHPTINAILNGIAAVLLFNGWLAIRRKDHVAHKKWMISAFAASTAFLASYLIYHYTHLHTPYVGPPLLKAIYLSILIPHIILAVVMLPFIFAAFYKAFKGDYKGHARITRYLWPVWMYVSVTGVIIYLMLYVFKPA